MIYLDNQKSLVGKGMALLLAIKDSDIRLASLYQCRHAVDNAIHIGGAFSATIPMVSLFYGGIIDVNVEQPSAVGQDMFVLSKGHAVATLASIYHDLGYFGREILENSRSVTSLLNGHPGPLLPGVHVATGPMGQGMGVAQGFAIAGQRARAFDVYAVTGDGELQEGPIWETVMYAGYKRLDNLCVMVDYNGGQLDNVNTLHFPYHNLAATFESFGWRVLEVDATQYETMHRALHTFKYGERDGRPTAIICKSTKGYGGFSDFMNNHKVNIAGDLLDQEEALQNARRETRVAAFFRFLERVGEEKSTAETVDVLLRHAREIGFEINLELKTARMHADHAVRTRKAPVRDKRIQYRADALPKLERGKSYGANKVIESAMKVMARDERIISVDSDLASTSGLQAGVGYVDKTRALNAGVAEANMMLIGEAFAVLGANAWVSTFCPFFDWKVLRRIAVGHQERLEVIAANGWLSEGHGIDLTLVATAADLETQSNGATHMGNDDVLMLGEAAYVQIINVSCPQQLLGIMRWIAEGNRGIIYLRVLRAPSEVLYAADFQFELGKSYKVKDFKNPDACIVSSGRGVYEALGASAILEKAGYQVAVIDMPSIDIEAIVNLHRSGIPVFIAEQNNGYLWAHFRKVLFEAEAEIDTRLLIPVNTAKGGLHYIHSGTYAELAAHYGLDAGGLAETIFKTLNRKQ